MFTKIHIVRKLNAKDDLVVCKIEEILQEKIPVPFVEDFNIDALTLVVAIGGDGTMLEAMRIAQRADALVTGINLGKVGFLTDFPCDGKFTEELLSVLHMEGKNSIEERIALHHHLIDKGEVIIVGPRPAFNEFVISAKYSDNLIRYNLFIGDRCAGVHRANALIIGTPTGSTAYSLSAGGGLLLPSMEAIQIVPVAPISMTSRPIIIPSHEEVRISIQTDGEWILKADGATLATFHNDSFIDTQVVINQAPRKVKILHSKHWSYFNMLTQKLGWKNQ